MNITDIARACHEANAAFCRSIGDNSQKSWDEAADWQRDSAVKGVEFVKASPEAGPSASHENWLKDKKAAGWKLGPVKDEKKKEHPAMVAYDKLPVEQKSKDYIFGAIAKSLLPVVDTVETNNQTLASLHEEKIKSLQDEHGKEVLVLNDTSKSEIEELRKKLADAEAQQALSAKTQTAIVDTEQKATQSSGSVVYSVTEDGKRLADLSQLTSKPLK